MSTEGGPVTAPAPAVRYRKKPVIVEAVQWTGENIDEIFELTGCQNFRLSDAGEPGNLTARVFDRLHSTWVGVCDGNWIIRGIQGEFYPCADDVFRETYEPAGADL